MKIKHKKITNKIGLLELIVQVNLYFNYEMFNERI